MRKRNGRGRRRIGTNRRRRRRKKRRQRQPLRKRNGRGRRRSSSRRRRKDDVTLNRGSRQTELETCDNNHKNNKSMCKSQTLQMNDKANSNNNNNNNNRSSSSSSSSSSGSSSSSSNNNNDTDVVGSILINVPFDFVFVGGASGWKKVKASSSDLLAGPSGCYCCCFVGCLTHSGPPTRQLITVNSAHTSCASLFVGWLLNVPATC